MKKYTQESKLSWGNLKNSSKQTGVLDLKPTGIVHSIGYKEVQIGQKESTVASDFLARHHQDAMNAYYMNQAQIINQTNRNIEFLQKRQFIERKIDAINEELKNPYITQNKERSLYDIKNQYEEQIEQLELNENPDIMKKIQELTNALIQSETQKQVLTKEIQEKDIAIAEFYGILQVFNQQIPELQAQIEVLQTANPMGGLGIQEPNVEPNIEQQLKETLKLKGEIKGDMRMFKLGKELAMPEDKIKNLFIQKEKFDIIKNHFEDHPEKLIVDNGYESEDIDIIGKAELGLE